MNIETVDQSVYGWDAERDRNEDECMFNDLAIVAFCLILAIAGIVSAHLQPFPRHERERARPSPSPSLAHFPSPPLEKSNVLILYD